MRTIKGILIAILYAITLPLVLLVIVIFDGAMSLWRFVESMTTEGSRSRDAYNRTVDSLHELIDCYKL